MTKRRRHHIRAIRNATNHELEWVQPRLLSDTHELHMLGDELLAKLVMRGSNSADAVCSDGSFTFQRKGLFKTHTVVYAGSSRAPMATFEPSGNESALTFVDGHAARYLWRKLGVGNNEYVWADSAGKAIVQFWPASAGTRARVRFLAGAAQTQELALLVLLGSFLASLAKRDVLIPALAITMLNRNT